MSNLISWIGLFGAASAIFISFWAIARYALLGSYRLNSEDSKLLYEKILRHARTVWVLKKEYVKHPKYPEIFEALVFFDGTPFIFHRSERLLTAGWNGKDSTSDITFFRWDKAKIERILDSSTSAATTTVSFLLPGGPDLIGEVELNPSASVFLNHGSYEDIELDVQRVVSGEIRKTSFLLYGEPGNGKSQFVKYIATKYKIPINVVYFQPDFSNIDIIRMFASAPRNSIILMEDFDTYFDKRECLMSNEQMKFTFDSIINSLDGVHNDYQGMIFAMTVNDISKVDDSLKMRPSRFKFVREFSRPNNSIIKKILGENCDSADYTGKSLDEIFNELDKKKRDSRANDACRAG